MDKQIKRVRHAADKTTESGGLEGRRLSRTRSSVSGVSGVEVRKIKLWQKVPP